MPSTDPINIPIKATDTASGDMRKVAQEADKLSRKGVTLPIKGADGGPAGGVLGKLKGAFDGISSTAIAAGGAIAGAVGIAKASLGAFQNLALEVGKFADSTGLSNVEASKFIEVADDMGVSAEAVEKLVGFFNKTIGKTPGLLAQYGVELATAKDGTTDVQQTFLNAVDAVDAIKDPTERAATAAQLFGKSWTGAAELIRGGSAQLKTAFDQVSDQKIITDDELQKARDARAGFDQLSDAIDNLQLELGQRLAPVLSSAAQDIAGFVEKAGALADKGDQVKSTYDKVIEKTRFVGDAFKFLAGSADEAAKHTDKHKDSAKEAAAAQDELRYAITQQDGAQQTATGSTDAATTSADDHASALDRERDAAQHVADELDTMRKALSMKKEVADLTAQVGGAMLTVGSGAQVAAGDVYSIQQSIIDVGAYAGANPVEIQSVVEEASRGEWDAVARTVQGWANANPVELKVKVAYQDFRNAASAGQFATGAAVPAAPMPAGASSPGLTVAPIAVPVTVAAPVAPVVHVTVNAGMVADSATLARALTRGERSAARLLGPRWREVAAA